MKQYIERTVNSVKEFVIENANVVAIDGNKVSLFFCDLGDYRELELLENFIKYSNLSEEEKKEMGLHGIHLNINFSLDDILNDIIDYHKEDEKHSFVNGKEEKVIYLDDDGIDVIRRYKETLLRQLDIINSIELEKTTSVLFRRYVPKVSNEQLCMENADQYFSSYCEYTKYGTDKLFWGNDENEVASGIRIAIGKYIQQITTLKIPFSEYVSCLSNEFANGSLKKARRENQLPQYSRANAMKHRIGKNCGEIGTASLYGYE